MAVKARSIDGLVQRLLRQQARPAGVGRQKGAAEAADHHAGPLSEAAAEKPHAVHPELPERPGEKALESHLLSLYRSSDKGGR